MRSHLLLLLLAVLSLVAGCDTSPVTGATCGDDLLTCDDGICVDPRRNPVHCGGCNIVCGAFELCTDGFCQSIMDTSPDTAMDAPDTTPPEDTGVDAAEDTGPADTGPAVTVCSLGEIACGAVCTNPFSDRDNCGSCGRRCGSAQICASGVCALGCDAPLMVCDEACVDTSSNLNHCGGCDSPCAGLCIDGTCETGPGELVLIGHDFRESRVGMDRIVGNAAGLAGDDVRGLVFEGDARPSSLRGVDAAITDVAASSGFTYRDRSVPAQLVTGSLVGRNLLIVSAQADADDAELARLGTLFSAAITEFLERGGVVVVLDAGGSNLGTYNVVQALDVSARSDITLETVRVVDAGDPVAVGVPSTYRAETSSSSFTIGSGNVVVALEDDPVVVHWTVE